MRIKTKYNKNAYYPKYRILLRRRGIVIPPELVPAAPAPWSSVTPAQHKMLAAVFFFHHRCAMKGWPVITRAPYVDVAAAAAASSAPSSESPMTGFLESVFVRSCPLVTSSRPPSAPPASALSAHLLFPRQGKREDRSCPPRLEELKKEAQGILSPDIFDGARFEFNKTLTQKFQLNHNITLGSSQVPSSPHLTSPHLTSAPHASDLTPCTVYQQLTAHISRLRSRRRTSSARPSATSACCSAAARRCRGGSTGSCTRRCRC